MADMKVAPTAPAAPAAETQAPQKAEGAVGKFFKGLKDAMFGKTGTAVMAGAAGGALIAGLPGAAVGAVVGLGVASATKSAEEGKKGMALLNAGLAGGLGMLAFGPIGGLLIGAGAYAFASGKAQEAAAKVGEGIQNLGAKVTGQQDQPEPAPAQ